MSLRTHIRILLLAAAVAVQPAAANERMADPTADPTEIDTVIRVDRVQVTAIKQGGDLRSQPVAASIVGRTALERRNVTALKDLAATVPNLHLPDYGSRMTSTIYVRGLGARIDQPAMGLNVDNVPVMNKDNYDLDLADVERIEVLRGPQSTLYGRNTMGGVINVYTLSPLSYEGARLGMEYASGNTWRLRASSYYRATPETGFAALFFYTRTDGRFTNLATGKKCDGERYGGGRIRFGYAGHCGLRIDNTLNYSTLDQGGYPYASVATGEIRYNDPCGYRRTTLSDGLTLRYDTGRLTLSSITSYQYSDDEMTLDQDFLPLSYFTLTQARTEHTVTEDIVLRSHGDGRYGWLLGAFGFYRHTTMEAPVRFKQDGIGRLILPHVESEYMSAAWDGDEFLLESRFRNPVYGAAIYHESDWRIGRWRLAAGLRLDHEQSRLRYRSTVQTGYTVTTLDDGMQYPVAIDIDDGGTLRNSFTTLLPKFSASFAFGGGDRQTLYVSASKGYKAGGFNTQMFSDVLQQRMMKQMGVGTLYDIDRVVSYKPEKSWNYELGGRFANRQGTLRADAALFRIDCRDQQLTVFPEGTTTGRMMTNAGHTRSYGAELAVEASPWRNMEINAAYGYTHARFVSFDNGLADYAGRRIPYAPQHTASLSVAYTIPVSAGRLERIVIRGGANGLGRIYWNEENSCSQPFYTLLDASLRFEHRSYALDLWCRNLADRSYDTFYFVSIGNAFVQRGRPRTFGITLNINL